MYWKNQYPYKAGINLNWWTKFSHLSQKFRFLQKIRFDSFNNSLLSISFEKIKKKKNDFGLIWINKGKSVIPPLFNNTEVLSSASSKANLFAKNFSRNSYLDDSGISLPVFPSRTNLKLNNFSVTPKMIKKVYLTCFCQRHLVLIVFQWWF